MDAKILIESFAEFARSKNVDRPTMIRILEDVFRAMIRKKNLRLTRILTSRSMLTKEILKFSVFGKS